MIESDRRTTAGYSSLERVVLQGQVPTHEAPPINPQYEATFTSSSLLSSNSIGVVVDCQNSKGSEMLRDLWLKCVIEPHNSGAWDELLARVHLKLCRIAGRLAANWGLRDDSEIEDLVQDMCLKISQVPASVVSDLGTSDIEVQAYLNATAANAARDSLRLRFADKRGKHATRQLDANAEELVGEIGGSDRDLVFRQVDELLSASVRERAIFWLYYRQGYTSKEISLLPAIGLTSKGVESLLRRLTSLIRVRIEDQNRAGARGQ